MEKISGVYKITNNITGDFYIGSSCNIKYRWLSHKAPSTWIRCPNSRMYQDMAKYDLSNFKLDIIEETDNLKEREQYWIEQLNPTYNNYRANGRDFERYRKVQKEYKKEYVKTEKYKKYKESQKEYQKKYQHTDKYKEYQKEYSKTEKCKDSKRKSNKKYYSQPCLYEGETTTLGDLGRRFYKQCIPHAFLEAKKYLL